MHTWMARIFVIITVMGYAYCSKRLVPKTIKYIKAILLTIIFVLSLFPKPVIFGGMVYNVEILVLMFAGIEAVDAWREYSSVKGKRKKSTNKRED